MLVWWPEYRSTICQYQIGTFCHSLTINFGLLVIILLLSGFFILGPFGHQCAIYKWYWEDPSGTDNLNCGPFLITRAFKWSGQEKGRRRRRGDLFFLSFLRQEGEWFCINLGGPKYTHSLTRAKIIAETLKYILHFRERKKISWYANYIVQYWIFFMKSI